MIPTRDTKKLLFQYLWSDQCQFLTLTYTSTKQKQIICWTSLALLVLLYTFTTYMAHVNGRYKQYSLVLQNRNNYLGLISVNDKWEMLLWLHETRMGQQCQINVQLWYCLLQSYLCIHYRWCIVHKELKDEKVL